MPKANLIKHNKERLLNFAVGASIPAGTVLSGTAGGCTGVCGSCGGTCLGGLALAAYLGGRLLYKKHFNSALTADGTNPPAQP